MDTLQLIASATGLGVLAGVRLYLTVFCLGLAIRFGLFELSQSFASLHSLGNWWVIGLSGLAVIVEFAADKIPWLDSAWDSLHTFIRPIGAALLSVAAFDSIDPGLRTVLVLLTGGAALTSHSAKAATRVAVNHSPEPFSNVALSLIGDAAVPFSLWLLVEYPLLVGGVALVFVVIAVSLAPWIFRTLRVQYLALKAWFATWFSLEEVADTPKTSYGLNALPRSAAVPLPDRYARYVKEKYQRDDAFALRGVFRRGPRKMRNRVGYVCVLPDRFVFLAQRTFGMAVYEAPLNEVRNVQFDDRILMDGLRIHDLNGEVQMDLFKQVGRGGEHLASAWQVSRATA